MSNRVGVMLRKFGDSDMAKALITNANALKDTIELTSFYTEPNPIMGVPSFAVIQQEYIWGYKGPIIATDMISARRLIKAAGPTHKFFYIWDLEWTNSIIDYTTLQYIYQNPNLELIARNAEQADIVDKCWKKPVVIIEDFNYEQLTEFIQGLS